MDRITRELQGLTARVIAYRFQLESRRMGNLIEIKGLGAAVQSAKKGIADVRAETAGLQLDASALVSALQDVRQQIRQAQSDLQFEAETLGNGSPNSAPSSASAQGTTTAHATISPETHTRISDGSVIQK